MCRVVRAEENSIFLSGRLPAFTLLFDPFALFPRLSISTSFVPAKQWPSLKRPLFALEPPFKIQQTRRKIRESPSFTYSTEMLHKYSHSNLYNYRRIYLLTSHAIVSTNILHDRMTCVRGGFTIDLKQKHLQ